MKNKVKKKVSNIMLALSCTMIILYTVASFVLQYFTQVEISTTLTTAWFTYWSSELFLLAGIKVSKVIKGTEDAGTENTYVDTDEFVEEC